MTLPNTVALTTIADGSSLVASPVRNNFSDVQTAVNGLISDLDDGAIDGDALVWDATNSKWTAASKLPAGRPRAPRVVTSAMSGGPPASPVDGDIWIASAVDGNGTRWQFQYNAGSASAYKWEFIGGAPLLSSNGNAFNLTGDSAWHVLDTALNITVSRPGDYVVGGGWQLGGNIGSAGIAESGVGINAAIQELVAYVSLPASSFGTLTSMPFLCGALAANDIVSIMYSANQAYAVLNRSISLTPKRVS